MRYLTVALLALLAVALPATAQQETRLRHDNYLAFVGKAGETVHLKVTSIRRPPYQQDLQIAILDKNSREVLQQTVPLGASATINYKVETPGLHVVAVSTGEPLATARLVDKPFALVAWDKTRLWICGACARQYFLVPKGCRHFDFFLTASVTGEGATLRILSPDNKPVVDQTGDFDKLTRIQVEVPAGMDDKPWSFTLTNPAQKHLFLDDVEVYLGRPLPPYLCEDPAWLPTFTKLRAAAERISQRVSLQDVPLRNGNSVEVHFKLPAAPTAKMAALRARATDVDYIGEGTFTVNGKGPYTVPVTGDGATMDVTVPIKPSDLRAGDNVIVFKHNNRASTAMQLTDVQILLGDEISTRELW